MFGATILSGVLHALAIAATVIVWPFVAPPIALPPDIVPVDLLTVADTTNIAPAQEAPEEPPPEPQQLAMPVIETPQPEFAPPEEDAVPLEEPEEKAPEPEPEKPKLQEPRFAFATPRVKPKPEPKKPDFDLSQIDKAIARAEKAQPKSAEAPPSPSKRTLKGAGAQSALTMSEIDALRSQMSKCWNVLAVGAPDPTALVLRVRVFLNQDGTVASKPELIDQGRLGDPYFRAAADAAIRAVVICGPYELPVEKYDSWKEIEITFDPRQMAGY